MARPKSALPRGRGATARTRKADTLERLLEQEEDTLEFSVCLPSPSLDKEDLLTGGSSEPVVFLLGWEGEIRWWGGKGGEPWITRFGRWSSPCPYRSH